MAERKILVSGNWKMNLTHFDAIQMVQKLYWALKPEDYRSADVSVHPPFTDLRSVQTLVEADSMPIILGAQNCHYEDAGAFTGEVSPVFLEKLNVAYVIVGHSERRQYFGETDELVAKKAAAVVKHGMTPIVCVGETLEEREAGRAEDVAAEQTKGSLAQLTAEQVASAVVAYEPVWAIGTGKTCDTDIAQGMCKSIRGVIAEAFGADAAEKVRIQYGGSVKANNAAELLSQADIDGALVGGASLDPEGFAAIVKAATPA